jgi:hypothetical protein
MEHQRKHQRDGMESVWENKGSGIQSRGIMLCKILDRRTHYFRTLGTS